MMKIKIKNYLAQDLENAAKKRSITTELLVEQILSSAMLAEGFLTDDDNQTIMAIYKKYLN